MSRRILLVLTSRWMIPGLHPVCKYSRPAEITTLVTLRLWKFIFAWTKEKSFHQPLAASSASWRRASQSKCFLLTESVRKFMSTFFYFLFGLSRLTCQKDWKEISCFMGRLAYHVYDLAKFRCACIHKPAYVGIVLRSIRLKEPSFCGEFSTREQPANMFF